jgi:hypothetical protein
MEMKKFLKRGRRRKENLLKYGEKRGEPEMEKLPQDVSDGEIFPAVYAKTLAKRPAL